MQLNLNLLSALDALLEEGSVAGAAARMQVSAPAISCTLMRIRRATGDQILVPTGRIMTPTPHAIAVRSEVHALVQQAAAVLAPQRPLDLEQPPLLLATGGCKPCWPGTAQASREGRAAAYETRELGRCQAEPAQVWRIPG